MSNEENATDGGITKDDEENLKDGQEDRQIQNYCKSPSTAYCLAGSTRGAAPQRR